jgi:hypothetical protein
MAQSSPILSSHFSRSDRSILKKDLSRLENFQFNLELEPLSKRLFELEETGPNFAWEWLSQRVRYLENNNSKALMSNIGAAWYAEAKARNSLATFHFHHDKKNVEEITIKSPRVGLVLIGKSTFDLDIGRSYANSLARLILLIHEARHSDGHQKSLGFFHVACPKGHDYAGQFACDNNRNGAYAVGAQIAREFRKNCSSCSVGEKEALRLIEIDSRSRVLEKTTIEIDRHDPLIDDQLKLQKEILLDAEQIAEGQDKIILLHRHLQLGNQIQQMKLDGGYFVEIPTEYWDTTPEGEQP